MNVKIGNMRKILCLALCLGMPFLAWAQQDTLTYERDITLTEAIALARAQSVDAAVALNELKTAYWEYRTFRANLLPEVSFTGTLPNYSKSYSSYQNSDGSYSFVRNARRWTISASWAAGGTTSSCPSPSAWN